VNKILIILTLFFVLSGCSKTAKTRTFTFFSGRSSLTGVDILGGAILKLVNSTSGEVITMDLTTSPYTAIIPNGTWNMYIVGFVGPALWQGATYCGENSKTLNGNDVDITINATTQTCSNSPYTLLIATKISAWDASLWDVSQWRP
jgi:hypothetical protein